MYTRFFRWASDRLKDEGVIVTAAATPSRRRLMTAFARMPRADYCAIRIVDLGGDVRANPKLSGTKHNAFGIQTGVAMAFLVRRKGQSGECRIFYSRRPELETAEEKLSFLSQAKLSTIVVDEITPDAKANWINQTTNDFEGLLQLVSSEGKAKSQSSHDRAIFKLSSNGLKSQRDEWVYDRSRDALEAKAGYLVKIHKRQRARMPTARRERRSSGIVS